MIQWTFNKYVFVVVIPPPYSRIVVTELFFWILEHVCVCAAVFAFGELSYTMFASCYETATEHTHSCLFHIIHFFSHCLHIHEPFILQQSCLIICFKFTQLLIGNLPLFGRFYLPNCCHFALHALEYKTTHLVSFVTISSDYEMPNFTNMQRIAFSKTWSILFGDWHAFFFSAYMNVLIHSKCTYLPRCLPDSQQFAFVYDCNRYARLFCLNKCHVFFLITNFNSIALLFRFYFR